MKNNLTELMEKIAGDTDFKERLEADKSILADELGWAPEAIESFSFEVNTKINCGTVCGCGSYSGEGGLCICTNSGGSGAGDKPDETK